MTSFVLSSLILIFSVVSLSAASDTKKAAIRKVLNDSYIDGIQNRQGAEIIRKGFWPHFEMLIFRDNVVDKMPLENWIANVEKQRAENPGTPEHPASARFIDIDVTGNAAMVKLELYRQGQKLFTDYFTLYKFDDGWKIVGKTFYRH